MFTSGIIPISEQIDTKVVTQYILRYKFLIKLNVLVYYLTKLFQ